MRILAGSTVSYIGDGSGHDEGLALGDRGKVVAEAGDGSHVSFRTGLHAGAILLIANIDLAPDGRVETVTAVVDNATEARHIIATGGVRKLAEALFEDGWFEPMLEDAQAGLVSLTTAIRRDPSIASVLSEMSDDEQHDFLLESSRRLISAAYGEEVV